MSDPTNPLEEYIETKEAAKVERKQRDLELWHQWNTGGQKPEHLEPLLKAFESTIGQRARMSRPPAVDPAAFRADLTGHAIRAFQTYDPTKAALNTHLTNYLKKSQRYGNRYANVGYLPEEQSSAIGPIDRAHETLMETLGRAPTPHEIHEHLLMDPDRDFRRLTPKRIATIQANRFRDIPMSRSAGKENDSYDYTGAEVPSHGFEDQQIAVAANILPQLWPNNPAMHQVFNHTFATNDHTLIASTGALAKKIGKSDSQVARMKTIMGNDLRRYMGLPDLKK